MSKGNRTRRREAGLLPEPVRCHARNRHGEPCKNFAMHGQQVCGKHGGKASQNLRKAEERLATHADVLMKELLHIATSAESEAVRLAAVRDALDRIGIGSKRELEVTMAPWEVAISGILVDGPDDELDTIDGEVVEEVRAIPPSDLADQDKLPALTDDPPHYSRGNRLRGR